MADEEIPRGEGGEPGGDLGAKTAAPFWRHWRDWLAGRAGWVVLIEITLMLGIFFGITIMLKSGGKPVAVDSKAQMRSPAVEMLGREVQVKEIYQLIPGPRGRRMTIGLEMVLVLGQLPEETIDGAPLPTEKEIEVFLAAVTDMEPQIRSRMNSLLQKIPFDEYESPEVYDRIKADIMDYINAELEGLFFAAVRPDIGKRRITDVLFPLFVRQRR